MKPSIPNPCPENWDDMKIGLISRHCESCRKEVMDFTQMSRHEILQYLIENRDKKICAHVYPSQLDYRHDEMLVTIRSLEKKYRNTNLSFYLLTLATLSLMGCETDQGRTALPVKKEVVDENSVPTLGKVRCEVPQEKTINQVEKIPHAKVVNGTMEAIPPVAIEGDIIMPEPMHVIDDPNTPRLIVEVMPEFEGGTEALMNYIKENLKYPAFEKQNEIQGTVYASFVVDKEGKISQPKILRSVSGAKNFDAEVIRVIKGMPDWKPGKQDGVAVPVLYNLPFRFRL